MRYLRSTAADIVLLQELRVPATSVVSAERRAAREGWSLSVEPANLTAAGSTSAGVAVGVRGHIGMALPRRREPCSELDGRIQARWVGAVCKGGIHLISAYFHTGEGLSQRNLDMMHHVARLIASLRGPWVIGGDFNLPPDVVRSCGWLSLVAGVIAAPGEATCNEQTYDYFIVSETLKHAIVAVSRVVDAGISPHSPSRLLLRAGPRQSLVRK
jgi:hypothetical protein